ncbi:hypothetical protein ACN2C7_07055 [Caulobacter sp. ErkDOM-E]|uniref:hypothetical protein n=1 Tax=Caulobacter sp. ErkDOM-E TaxID=3402778 RepID=UPI003AF41F45
MVSIGSAKRHRLFIAALGGLAALLLLGAMSVPSPGKPQASPKPAPAPAKPRPDSRQSLTAYERETLAVDRAANNIGERANSIADAQRVYGLLQLILGVFGVAFTGAAAFFAWRATYWAKTAAHETKRSADADNAALAITTTGMAEARKDAIEQGKRFTEQLALSQETMEYTARSSRAMETSATATRRMASTAGATAKDQLRPYVYLVDEQCELVLSLGTIYGADAAFGFKNFGQTPAKNVRFRAAFDLRIGPWNLDFTPDLTPIYELHFGDLPPGHLRHMNDGYKAQPLEQYQLALKDDGAALVLYGEVLYEDAGGGKYRTTFRRAANGPIAGRLYTFHIPPNGNEAT